MMPPTALPGGPLPFNPAAAFGLLAQQPTGFNPLLPQVPQTSLTIPFQVSQPKIEAQPV